MTTDRDLEAMITIKMAPQTEKTISARAGQIVETTYFTQKLFLLTEQNSKMD